jgi:hypothetical protein
MLRYNHNVAGFLNGILQVSDDKSTLCWVMFHLLKGINFLMYGSAIISNEKATIP